MRYRVTALLCLASFNACANVLQYFTGISYSNPAEHFKVKKNQFIIGASNGFADIRFKGSVLNLNNFEYDYGRSASDQFTVLPYGRIASRIDRKVVFAVDFTEPFNSNLVWGDSAVTRYASTETLMTDVDVSPRFSYSVNEKLHLGAGLNFNFLKNNETNWALPTDRINPAPMINRTAGFGVGYNAGLYYAINPTNYFGLSYFSAIRQDTKGVSIFNGVTNPNLQFNFHFPATTVLNYTHIFNPAWLASVQFFRTEWNINQYARILHTAAPPPLNPDFIFTMKYRPSLAFAGVVRHQVSERMGLSLIAMQDNGPERNYLRTINFPSDIQYFLALAADYNIAKNTTIEILLGSIYSKTMINNKITLADQTLPFTTGQVNIFGEVLDLKLKIQV